MVAMRHQPDEDYQCGWNWRPAVEYDALMRRLATTCGVWLMAAAAWAQDRGPVEFNRDVRPILSDACFQCHGPDAKQRQADLRLDQRGGGPGRAATGKPAIVPGKLAESELFRRITAADPAERMPPAEARARSSAKRRSTRCAAGSSKGPKWQKHWSFLPPTRPAIPPAVAERRLAARARSTPSSSRGSSEEGLAPSPEADRATLIRRVTLDLTGLPPTPAEVDAFLADDSPDAYERVVDRLLASPRYGERMAVRWLDAARYADTNGYQSDGERHMWRWRDWVIDAFNAQHAVRPVHRRAARRRPAARRRRSSRRSPPASTATTAATPKAASSPRSTRVEYVVDRVETTATVWLGLTLGCARCHDHKFDPITQKEFYQLFAFFNNVPEKGRAIKFGNSPPFIKAPTREQQARARRARRASSAAAERQSRGIEPRSLPTAAAVGASAARGADRLVDRRWACVALRLDGDADETAERQRPIVRGRRRRLRRRPTRPGGRLRRQASRRRGRRRRLRLLRQVLARRLGLDPTERGGGTIVSRMTDVHEGDGYQLAIVDGQAPGQPRQALARRRAAGRDRGRRSSPAAGITSPSPTTASRRSAERRDGSTSTASRPS